MKKIKTPIGIIEKTDAKNKSINIKNKIATQYKKTTSFDLSFYNFGTNLSSGINSVTKNSKNNLKISNKDLIKIKKIANKPLKKVTNNDKKLYLISLKNFSKNLKNTFLENIIEATIVPFKGGGLLANFYEIELEKIIPINCKRVQLKEKNSLGLGMNIGIFNNGNTTEIKKWYFKKLKSLNKKNIAFLEIAVASGLTTTAFILELVTNDIKPKKIFLVAPFISYKGIDIILKLADFYNIKIEVITNLYIERLGNYWTETEDSLLDIDGKFIIGKATTILEQYIKKYDLKHTS